MKNFAVMELLAAQRSDRLRISCFIESCEEPGRAVTCGRRELLAAVLSGFDRGFDLIGVPFVPGTAG
jgi:hypothetical protein